jgi:pyruvate formate lyase activating enzyme
MREMASEKVVNGVRQPLAGDVPLAQVIDPLVREGELYEKLADDAVRCYACGHNCVVKSGGRGICQVRYNLGGKLYVPWGYVSGLNCDPTEKKPYYHVYPGSATMTFGMLGCSYHCSNCQNWDISQSLRDADAGEPPTKITPEQIVRLARQYGARCIASSYNEPLITSEWAISIFKLAKGAGLTCLFVSNGDATRGVLEYIRPYTDGFKVDLKTMQDRNYRQLGAVLQNVLDSIRLAHAMGFWVELVTLVIPGFNDSDGELREAAQFIRSVSPDIPWHVTAFHKDYRMQGPDNTPARTLVRAAEIGYAEGLHFVYSGNLPGRTGSFENTYCPNCHAALIERSGFRVRSNTITPQGTCPRCQTAIAGIW